MDHLITSFIQDKLIAFVAICVIFMVIRFFIKAAIVVVVICALFYFGANKLDMKDDAMKFVKENYSKVKDLAL